MSASHATRHSYGATAASLSDQERGAFVIRVYQYLLVAVAAFVGFESLLFMTGAAQALFDVLAGTSAGWLLVLGGFMIVQHLASAAAHNIENTAAQHAGLFAMVAAEALLFAPFLWLMFNHVEGGGGNVAAAAVITAVGFAGLSVVAFTTRHDLSVLRPLLMWGFVAALVLIGAAVLFGLSLGVWFSVGMVTLAGGSILYQTQAIMAQYPSDAHVGAAVQLFASVMMLFWYVLRVLMHLRR